MIGKIIELSIRNRLMVLLLTATLVAAGIWMLRRHESPRPRCREAGGEARGTHDCLGLFVRDPNISRRPSPKAGPSLGRLEWDCYRRRQGRRCDAIK